MDASGWFEYDPSPERNQCRPTPEQVAQGRLPHPPPCEEPVDDSIDPAAVSRWETLQRCARGTCVPTVEVRLPAVAGVFSRWADGPGEPLVRVMMPLASWTSALLVGRAADFGLTAADRDGPDREEVWVTCTVEWSDGATSAIRLPPTIEHEPAFGEPACPAEPHEFLVAAHQVWLTRAE